MKESWKALEIETYEMKELAEYIAVAARSGGTGCYEGCGIWR